MKKSVKKEIISIVSFINTVIAISLGIIAPLYIGASIKKGKVNPESKSKTITTETKINTGNNITNTILKQNCIKNIKYSENNMIEVSFKDFQKLGLSTSYNCYKLSETNFNQESYDQLAEDILYYITDGKMCDANVQVKGTDQKLINKISEFLHITNGTFTLQKNGTNYSFKVDSDQITKPDELFIPDVETIKKMYKKSSASYENNGYPLITLNEYFSDDRQDGLKNSIIKAVNYQLEENNQQDTSYLQEDSQEDKVLKTLNEALNYNFEYKEWDQTQTSTKIDPVEITNCVKKLKKIK